MKSIHYSSSPTTTSIKSQKRHNISIYQLNQYVSSQLNRIQHKKWHVMFSKQHIGTYGRPYYYQEIICFFFVCLYVSSPYSRISFIDLLYFLFIMHHHTISFIRQYKGKMPTHVDKMHGSSDLHEQKKARTCNYYY